MATALHGVRVLDFTRVVAGPYCTLLMGDLGADVIKIEEPTKGDELRTLVVYRRPEDEDFFYTMNRNKRSVAVDLKTEEGREIAYGLAARVDVAVENFRPGVAARLGIDHERLRAINPSLVYCSISGFGQTGPYRERAAYDSVIQAMSGSMGVTGPEEGPPMRTGLLMGDLAAAWLATVSILAAVIHSRRTGEGQYIDVAILDSAIAMWGTGAAQYLATGKIPRKMGNERTQRVPSNCYQAGDGRYIQIVANTPPLWKRLCGLVGMPEILSDPRYDTMAKRIENRKEVNALVEEMLRAKSASEWQSILGEGGVPCGRVNNLDEVFADPQVVAREMLQTIEHPVSGPIRLIGFPPRLSGTPAEVRMPPPLLGQHTEEVLSQLLDFGSDRLEELEQKGIIRRRRAPEAGTASGRM